jgi:hypothetical protein
MHSSNMELAKTGAILPKVVISNVYSKAKKIMFLRGLHVKYGSQTFQITNFKKNKKLD